MKTKLVIKEGRDLTREELNIINFWREKEFGSKNAIQPKENDDNWNKKYFLLFGESGVLVAFARLHEVTLEFLGKECLRPSYHSFY